MTLKVRINKQRATKKGHKTLGAVMYVRLEPEIHARLMREAHRQEATAAELVRHIVTEWLAPQTPA
jgi:predicted HicB family RNase H-like nuclease